MEFEFPRLAQLVLCKLPQLRAFYMDAHTVEMPVLYSLTLRNCWTPQTKEDYRMQQPLLSVGKVHIQTSCVVNVYSHSHALYFYIIFVCDVICMLSDLSTLGDIEYSCKRSHDDVGRLGSCTSVSELLNSLR